MHDILKRPEYESFLNSFAYKNAALIVITGSHAYGLDTDSSDIDIRGFFYNDIKDFFSLYAPKCNYDHIKTDTVLWSFHKFVKLLSSCNPNIVDVVGVPEECIIHCDKTAQYLIDHPELWLSKRIYFTMTGYSISILRRLKNAIRSLAENKKEEFILDNIKAECMKVEDELKQYNEDNLISSYIKYNPAMLDEIYVNCIMKNIPIRKYIAQAMTFNSIIDNFNKAGHRNNHRLNAIDINDETPKSLYKHASCIIRTLCTRYI